MFKNFVTKLENYFFLQTVFGKCTYTAYKFVCFHNSIEVKNNPPQISKHLMLWPIGFISNKKKTSMHT